MPKISNNLPFPSLPRLEQLNSFCCGPATLEMLLGFAGVKVNQTKIIQSAEVADKIRERGVTAEELALAAARLAPQLQFWLKRYSTIDELARLINEFTQPVGIEWQGVFEEKEEDEENADEDPGHYSVITGVDLEKNLITLADPYKHYAGKDRQFTLLEFERRWWDINEVIDQKTHCRYQVDDYHTLFIVVPKKETFPKKLGMEKG